jgi:hypothetical protein
MSNKMMLLTAFAFVGIGTFVEKKFATEYIPFLYEPSPVFPVLPRVYGLTVLVLGLFSFWHLIFGFEVGKARKQCKDAAEKAGEKDLAHYSPPFLYAQGTSEHAIKLNQIQRAHQHVLECMTAVYISTLLNSLVFPLTSFVNTALWACGRFVWSTAYAQKGASGRYSHPLSMWLWRGMIINYLLSFFVAFCFMFGSPW